jgi:Trypsin-like peptidase domain
LVKKSLLPLCITSVALGITGLTGLTSCSSGTSKTTEITSLPTEAVETTAPISTVPTTSVVAADSWADVVDRVRPAVVRIEVQTCGNDSGVGSGFAIDGWIVTNRHVVEGYRNLVVVNADGNMRLPEQVRVSKDLDLALIKIPSEISMSWATKTPRVADEVAALGFPRGIGFSFTKGSISALDVRVEDGDLSVSGLLQTDTAVNPGNSGGPLIDKSGNVLGVVVLKRNDSEGLAFAIDGRQAQVFMSGEKGQPLEPCTTEGPTDPDNPEPEPPAIATGTPDVPVETSIPEAASTAPETGPENTPEIAGSGPEAVVKAFYAAVEAGAYDVAWRIGGRNLGKNPTLKDFTAGYKDTESSAIRIVSVEGNIVTVEVTAVEKTKTGGRQVSTYVGTYEVVDDEIVSGKFKLTNRE